MGTNNTKKEMVAKYVQRPIIGGVYAIRNTVSGKLLLGSARELSSMRNRFAFSQKMDSCIEFKLKNDWKTFGGDKFRFEVLEELKKTDTQTNAEYKADLDALYELWQEKLANDDRY